MESEKSKSKILDKQKRFHIGISAEYLPYYNKIKEIVETERKNYF